LGSVASAWVDDGGWEAQADMVVERVYGRGPARPLERLRQCVLSPQELRLLLQRRVGRRVVADDLWPLVAKQVLWLLDQLADVSKDDDYKQHQLRYIEHTVHVVRRLYEAEGRVLGSSISSLEQLLSRDVSQFGCAPVAVLAPDFDGLCVLAAHVSTSRLREGDVVVECDGQRLCDVEPVVARLMMLGDGGQARLLTVMRGGVRMDVSESLFSVAEHRAWVEERRTEVAERMCLQDAQADLAKRGKAAVPAGACRKGSSVRDRGGGGSSSNGARRRDEGRALEAGARQEGAPEGGGASAASDAGQQAQHIVTKLSRAALEELVLASLSGPNTVQEICARLPQTAPALTSPVGDDECAVNLGPLFSRVPNVVVIDILLRLSLEMRLACCLTVSKGFRVFRKEPALFEDIDISTHWLSSGGLRRLFEFLPDRGQQVLAFAPAQQSLPIACCGRADVANVWPGEVFARHCFCAWIPTP